MISSSEQAGRVLVLTGEGKGKSSSAFGMVFRAAGWGLNVCVIQFIKGQWQTGEQHAAQHFPGIEWHALGDGFTWDTKNPEQDVRTSREIWQFSQKKITSGAYDLVLLDEILYCCSYGWISGLEVAEFIRQSKPKPLHLLLTGRGAPPEVIDCADTVTEMGLVKHGFDQQLPAVKGVEF